MSKYFSKYLTVMLPDGSRKILKFYGKTDKEAEEKREEARLKNKLGLLTFNSNTPVANVADIYFRTYIKPTYSEYQYNLLWGMAKRIFIDDIGNIPISDLKPTTIKICLNKLSGKSKSYIDKAYYIINGIINMCISDGLIHNNPMLSVQKEKGKAGSRRSLTEYERDICMKIIHKYDKGLAFALMLGCGLRPGEARALTWSNVNLKNKEIHVTQAAKKQASTHMKMKVGEPKTPAGNRIIPTPDFLYELLISRPKEGIYVLSTKEGNPLTEQTLKRYWTSFYRLMQIEAGARLHRNKIIAYAEHIGRDITPYYLRHTCITGWVENGIKIKAVQYMAGHSTPKMAMEIYAHNTEQMEKEARDIVRTMFNKYATN